MNRLSYILLALAVPAVLAGCKSGREDGPVVENPAPDPVTEVSYAKGADISWVSEMEHDGIKFMDEAGQSDIFQILKNIGMNSIRLRVWVDPYDANGWSGREDVVRMASRARDAGLAIMIDFHYSDIFADPSRQTIPAAWSSYSGDPSKVSAAVASHTKTVLGALKSAGVVPAWVQVGNETNNGMAWEAGRIDWNKSGSVRYSDYVTVSNAGYDAVKSVFPDTPVIVHIANAHTAGEYDGWFFREFKEAGGKFDMIGLSHYPMTDSGKTTTQMNVDAIQAIKTLSSKLSCKVMVCEVGVKPSADDSGSVLAEFMQLAKALGSNVCAGVFYWEPEVDGKWKPAIYSKAGLVSNGWGAYGMGAFTSSGNVFKPNRSILDCFAN